MLKPNARKILAISMALVISLTLFGCGREIPAQPTEPVTSIETPAQVVTDTLETTGEIITAASRLGQLFVHYPIQINPGASKTITLEISIPSELANASPDAYKQDVRRADNPRPLGKFTEYTTLVLIAPRMRVELVAPNFTIQDLYPAEQNMDLLTPNTHTNWGWTITAPITPNEYVLVVKVSMAGNETPSWVGSFDILVETPTPTPVPTPLPLSSRIMQSIADNIVTLIGALLTTSVALIGLYLQHRKNRVTKK